MTTDTIHVAVGVIFDRDHNVLISRRADEAHQGGKWEFPGGKVEPGESVIGALQRELHEELGIRITSQFPVKKIYFEYPEKSVLLDVWCVTEFENTPVAREGQPIKWSALDALEPASFPPANVPIIRLLNYPRTIAITPQVSNLSQLQDLFRHYHTAGIKLVQLRQRQLSDAQYISWFEKMQVQSASAGICLCANQSVSVARQVNAAGFHASSERLMELESRPVDAEILFSAACHNLDQLQQASAVGADLALLSPVMETSSHPDDAPMGWAKFTRLASQVSLPVYALGGLKPEDLNRSWQAGAFGIAGIGAFLPSE